MHDISPEPNVSFQIRQVLTAWALAPDFSHPSRDGAAQSALDEAERVLGHPPPPPLQDLYRAFHGGEFVYSNFNFFPLHHEIADHLSLVTARELHRQWQWEVPLE